VALIIILPNFHNSASNGHLTALNIYESVCARLKGLDVFTVSGSESPHSVAFYKQRFGGRYFLEDSDFICKHMQKPYSLICPDDIEGSRSQLAIKSLGNHNCKRIHIIGYAPLGAFAPMGLLKRYFGLYDERFRLTFFDDWIAPAMLKKSTDLISIYQEPQGLPINWICALNGAADIAIYCGKGVYRLSYQHQQQFNELVKFANRANRAIHLITRKHPASKKSLYGLLSRCALLICLDPFSNIEREAIAIGCAVWKPNCPGPGKIPGIQYGDLDLNWTCAALNGSTSQIAQLKRFRIVTSKAYSDLLLKASKTKLLIYAKAIESTLRDGDLPLSSSRLADRTIIHFKHIITDQLMIHAKLYRKFLHPIPGSASDFSYPLANDSMQLESAINLLAGQPECSEEISYAEGLDVHFNNIDCQLS
jgi:hypothetical protein